MPNEDLALLLGMQPKDLRKLCGKLREDRLITVLVCLSVAHINCDHITLINHLGASHSRQETREGQLRPIHKDYYYVNYHATIDAIKYRIHRLSNQVSDLYKPSEQKKDFYCPRCQARYDQLEVLHNVDRKTGLFLCNRCSYLLQRDEENAANGPGHERSSTLNAQLGKFLAIMGQIDEQTIPANDFESALAVAIPVHRNEDINPRHRYNLVETRAAIIPAAVKGVTQLASTPLEISLTSSVESSAAEKAAESRRKAELAAQNALPVWHTASTITGETTALGNRERERLEKNDTQDSAPLAKINDERSEGSALNDELTAYYMQMQLEKEKSAREEQDESADSQDDEEEFEDVDGTDADAFAQTSFRLDMATGLSISGPSPNFDSSHIESIKPDYESESSGLGSTVSTPASMRGKTSIKDEVVADQRQTKRAKVGIEDAEVNLPAKNRDRLLEQNGDEIDDEEAIFEDALS